MHTTIRPSDEEIQAQLAKNKEQQKLAEQIKHSEFKELEDGAATKDEEEARESDAEEVKDIEEYLENYAVHESQLDRKDEERTEKVKLIKQIAKITIEVSYLCEKEFLKKIPDDSYTRVWLQHTRGTRARRAAREDGYGGVVLDKSEEDMLIKQLQKASTGRRHNKRRTDRRLRTYLMSF